MMHVSPAMLSTYPKDAKLFRALKGDSQERLAHVGRARSPCAGLAANFAAVSQEIGLAARVLRARPKSCYRRAHAWTT
jgi:hypothetical protein